MIAPASPSLIDHFTALKDPRRSWKMLYPLPEILPEVLPLPEVLLVVLCGTLAGAEDVVENRRRGGVNRALLRRFLPYAADLPSHDTLNDIINALDGDLFGQCFSNWAE